MVMASPFLRNKSKHIYGPNTFGGGFPLSSLGSPRGEVPRRQGKRQFPHVPSRVDSGHRTVGSSSPDQSPSRTPSSGGVRRSPKASPGLSSEVSTPVRPFPSVVGKVAGTHIHTQVDHATLQVSEGGGKQGEENDLRRGGGDREGQEEVKSRDGSGGSDSDDDGAGGSGSGGKPLREKSVRELIDSANLKALAMKLEEAMESISRNEVKMQELERSNSVMKQASERKVQELEKDNNRLKQDLLKMAQENRQFRSTRAQSNTLTPQHMKLHILSKSSSDLTEVRELDHPPLSPRVDIDQMYPLKSPAIGGEISPLFKGRQPLTPPSSATRSSFVLEFTSVSSKSIFAYVYIAMDAYGQPTSKVICTAIVFLYIGMLLLISIDSFT